MKLVLAVTLASLGFLAGCVAEPVGVTPQPGSTLAFPPAKVELRRYPPACTGVNPPFEAADLFSLDVTGDDATTPLTAIDLAFHNTLPLDQNIDVALLPFGIQSYSTDADGNMTDVEYGQQGTIVPATDNTFAWEQGADTTEVDSAPLTDVTLRFDKFPTQDGDDGTVEINMTFDDGGVLRVKVTEPAISSSGACPAG